MLIIGIDPGISGSICFFEDGKILDVVEMPTMTEGKKNKRDQAVDMVGMKVRNQDGVYLFGLVTGSPQALNEIASVFAEHVAGAGVD